MKCNLRAEIKLKFLYYVNDDHICRTVQNGRFTSVFSAYDIDGMIISFLSRERRLYWNAGSILSNRCRHDSMRFASHPTSREIWCRFGGHHIAFNL